MAGMNGKPSQREMAVSGTAAIETEVAPSGHVAPPNLWSIGRFSFDPHG
jgi:hypothetical protein